MSKYILFIYLSSISQQAIANESFFGKINDFVFNIMDLSRNRSPTVCLGQEKELKRSNIFRLTQLRHHHDCQIGSPQDKLSEGSFTTGLMSIF